VGGGDEQSLLVDLPARVTPVKASELELSRHDLVAFAVPASELPVVTAIFGMSPSLLLRGRRVRLASVSGLSTQPLTFGIVTCRRHFPTWMTSGMLLPVGTFSSVKRPFTSLSVAAIGCPDSVTLHLSQDAPVGIGSSAAFGTYATAL